MKITTHLPSTTPSALHRAATHPFLSLAGTGRLPKSTLASWLSQDRLYAQSYVRFIGNLLSKIQLPVIPSAKGAGEGRNIQEKIMGILIDALNNIQTELGFFEDTAGEYGLDLNTPPADLQQEGEGPARFGAGHITQCYIDMFMSASSPGVSLLEGLVVLWATEICYLKAWRFALAEGQQTKNEECEEVDMDGGALRNKFIPNWASREFEGFVGRIGGVVDEVAKIELGHNLDGGRDGLARCEMWWRQVVWLEERFWPVVE